MYNLIVYQKDPTLKHVTLKLKNGSTFIKILLKDICTISMKKVIKSSAWYSAFGYFKDSNGVIQIFCRDMSWILLHFIEHVDSVLHNDVELRLQGFKKEEQGDPLYFICLMDEIDTSNEQSLRQSNI